MPPLRGLPVDFWGHLGSRGPEGVQPALLCLQLTSTEDCSAQMVSKFFHPHVPQPAWDMALLFLFQRRETEAQREARAD